MSDDIDDIDGDDDGLAGRALSGAEVRVWLERSIRRRKARTEAKIAAMRAEGREPAPTGAQYCSGCPTFSFTLRWTGSGSAEAEVRLFAATRDGKDRHRCIWGDAWPEHGVRVDAAALLAFLAREWTLIGHHYLLEPRPWPADTKAVVLEVAGAVGEWLPRLALVVAPAELTAVCGAGEFPFRSETLIVVEVLRTLGDLLAARLRELGVRADVAAAWEAVRDAVDVFPFELEGSALDGREPDTTDAEADWYAARFGHDPELFRRAAVWLWARQFLWGKFRQGAEPAPAEWSVLSIPEGLPPREEVDRMAAEAAADEPDGLDGFVRMAVSDRSNSARATLFYKTWPERFADVNARRHGAWDMAPVRDEELVEIEVSEEDASAAGECARRILEEWRNMPEDERPD